MLTQWDSSRFPRRRPFLFFKRHTTPSGQSRVSYSRLWQPGKVANPARGQLNRETLIPPCPRSCLKIWFREVGSAVPSRVTLTVLYTILYSGWIWCLLTGFLPLSAAAPIYLHSQPPSGHPRVYQVAQLRTDGVPCRESAGTGPVVFKVVPVTGAAFAGYRGPINVRVLFSYTHYWHEGSMLKISKSTSVVKVNVFGTGLGTISLILSQCHPIE